MEGGVGLMHPLLLHRLGGVVDTGEVVQMHHRHFRAVVVGVEILLEGIEILTGRIGGFPLRDVIPRPTEGLGIREGEEGGRRHVRVRAHEHLLAGGDTTNVFSEIAYCAFCL